MAKYFTLQQCIYSRTLDKNDSKYCGPEEAEKIGGNVPGDDYLGDNPEFKKESIITNINNLMYKCVNPIKDRYPDTVITSVYRSKTLNGYIGGAEDSQHTFGYASDLVSINNFESHELFNWVIDEGIDFDQMIWEFPELGKGVNGSWIHISYKSGNNRKKTSLASNNSTLHERYGGPVSAAGYQNDIKRAYPEYLNEVSENAEPPVSKHPNADQVENGNGFYITIEKQYKNDTYNVSDSRLISVEVKNEDMNVIYKSETYAYVNEGQQQTLIDYAKKQI
tara:strand:- start:1308 stop:2144 length:837 start_codon:yes stop_codon:yes gene_type:complete